MQCATQVEVVRSQFALSHGIASPTLIDISDRQIEAVAVVGFEEATLEAFCSGVLVADDWFLTAKHCFEIFPYNSGIRIYFGPHILQPSAIREVSERITHPQADLILLRLKSVVAGEFAPLPIYLNDKPINDDWICRLATAGGYGEDKEGNRGGRRFITEPIVDYDETYVVIDGFGFSGACKGDSGGPLLITGDDGDVRLVGVLDMGQSNCAGNDFYIRVDIYRDWIDSYISG